MVDEEKVVKTEETAEKQEKPKKSHKGNFLRLFDHLVLGAALFTLFTYGFYMFIDFAQFVSGGNGSTVVVFVFILLQLLVLVAYLTLYLIDALKKQNKMFLIRVILLGGALLTQFIVWIIFLAEGATIAALQQTGMVVGALAALAFVETKRKVSME
ncbi:MAG: hypothetical protein ACOX28_03985 [Bacilli bacterium]|jgi:hypothetical protein